MSEKVVNMNSSASMSEIARRVRASRTDRGWSQSDLAEQAGVSRPSVARVEASEDVNTLTLSKIFEALGLELAAVKRRS